MGRVLQKIREEFTEAKLPSWKVMLLCSFDSFDDFLRVYAECSELQAKLSSFDFFFPAVTTESPFPAICNDYLPLLLAMSPDVASCTYSHV